MTKKKKAKRKAPRSVGRLNKRFELPRYTRADREHVLGTLEGVVAAPDWADRVRELMSVYFDGSVEGPPEAQETSLFSFLWWAFFDVPGNDRRRLAEVFFPPGEATRGELAFVRAACASSFRPYFVRDVRSGEGLDLEDALEPGPTVSVQERSASRHLIAGDLIASRVVPGASGHRELDGGLLKYSLVQHEAVLTTARMTVASLRDFGPAPSRKEIGTNLAPLLHELWRRPPMPTLHTTDGDPVLFGRSRFDVAPGASEPLAEALDAAPDFERADDAGSPAWTWLDHDAGDMPRSLAALELSPAKGDTPARLTAMTHSQPRVEELRARLAELVPEGVTYRATSLEDPERAMAAVKPGAGSEPIDLSAHPEARAAIEAMLERHVRGWPDENVPALDGLTPREAATRPELRDRLVYLLEDFERLHRGAVERGQPSPDPSFLWDELGLERRE